MLASWNAGKFRAEVYFDFVFAVTYNRASRAFKN